jgi:uncharacterized protein (DUF697 family)
MNQATMRARAFWQAIQHLAVARRSMRPQARETTAPTPVPLEGDLLDALNGLDAIRADCRRLVTRRASLSAGVAVVPLPMLDVGTDIAILLKLLPQINERFGLTPAQIEGLDAETKRIVMMFVSGVGSALVGRLITRELVVKVLMKMGVRVTTKGVVKFVPLLGQAISASISFGAMKLLGNRHIDDCYEVARRTLLEQARQKPAGDRWEVVG